MKTVAIIDYGMGNLHSVAKAVEHVAPEQQVIVSSDPVVIRGADRVILPGVGAIRDCMGEIHRLGFDDVVRDVMQDRPLLGICIGMQALMAFSEENGGVDCIDAFPARVRFFGTGLEDDGRHLKVPHMGWNQVRQVTPHPMWQGIADDARFYFVHSYYVEVEGNANVVGETRYGVRLAAAVAHENVFAAQFHPEKSHNVGLQLLRNFTRWDGRP